MEGIYPDVEQFEIQPLAVRIAPAFARGHLRREPLTEGPRVAQQVFREHVVNHRNMAQAPVLPLLREEGVELVGVLVDFIPALLRRPELGGVPPQAGIITQGPLQLASRALAW